MIELLSNVLFPSLMASLGWGISPYFDKKALSYYDNNIVFMLRIMFAGILGCLLFLITYNKNKSKFINNMKGIKYIAFSSFISIFIGTYFYYKAMSKTKNTTLVVLISYVLPLIFITLISHYLLKEKINLGMCISLLLVILGIVGFVYSSK
jgi:uncharacterized membrane protein